MPRGRPPGRTEEGEATREELFRAATARFASDGFEGASVRAIARDVGLSPGAMYRHFPSKQAIVLELYRRLTDDVVEVTLPRGRWQHRFVAAVRATLAILAPHRATLRAVLGELLVGQASLLGVENRPEQERVRAVYLRAVTGASNAPTAASPLGRLLYVAQLGVLLLWCVDRSPDQRATFGLIDRFERLASLFGLAIRLPRASTAIGAFADGLERALFG